MKPELEHEINQITASLVKAFAGRTEEVGISKAEATAMFKATADDEASRKAFAQSRAEVLLPLVDHQSTVRQIFTQEVLGAGAQSNYPISFDYTEFAAYMPKFGGNIVQVVEGDEIFIPTFGIEAGGRWGIDAARDGRLDLAGQVLGQIKSKIVAKEEFAGWRTIKGALSGSYGKQVVYCSGNSVDGVGTPANFQSFSKSAIVKGMVQMDIQRRSANAAFLSPRSLGDVLQWSQDTIDFDTQRDIYVNGGLPGGQLWGIKFNKVYDSSLVSDSEAYLFDTRTFGKMPIKQNLATYDDPMAIYDWQHGVLAREVVGFGVTDSWAVVKLILDSTHLGSACNVL